MGAVASNYDRRLQNAIRYAETAQWFIRESLGGGANGAFRFGASPGYSFDISLGAAFELVLNPGAAIVDGIPVRRAAATAVAVPPLVSNADNGRHDLLAIDIDEKILLRQGSVGGDPPYTNLVPLWRIVRKATETQITLSDNGTDAYLVDLRTWVN